MTTPRVTVPVEPTAEMLEAGILAAWPGPEIVYADEHAGPEFMLAAAFKAMLSVRGEVDRPVWFEGAPSQHHAKEWFIAETIVGDRVVLTALPEEYTYDFKTADETYIKADRIKRWMPFPDSEYLPPSPAPAPEGGAAGGSGDDATVLAEPQTFERFPALASHIERMAVGRSVGSLIEWDAFLRELNAALATREEAPAEAGENDDDASTYRPSIAGLSDYLWNQALAAESVESRCILEMWREAVDSSAQTGQSAMTLDRLCHVEDWAQAPSALRAQPPAREDAQPVAYRDIHRFAVVSSDYSRPFMAGAYETLEAATKAQCGSPEKWPIYVRYTHPAPDALRNALADLIENAVAARGCGLKNDPDGIVSSALFDTIMNGRAALATLQAEQGAK